MYDIRNHKIDAIWHKQTSNLSSGTIAPKFICLHYTTGWSGTGSRDWLLGKAGGHPGSRVSAHVVIDRDGTAWQIAPFNRKTWHAGPSRHGGDTGLNGSSIGIEFAGPGFLRDIGGDRFRDDYGTVKTRKQLDDLGGFMMAPHARIGSGSFCWPYFPAAQLEEGRKIVSSLLAKYPIRDIVSHEEIDTRGWKTDPGPAFPFAMFDELLRGAQDEEERIYRVTATRLYIRSGPGTANEPIDPPEKLSFGTRVRWLGSQGKWHFVETEDDQTVRGWMHGDYLARVWPN